MAEKIKMTELEAMEAIRSLNYTVKSGKDRHDNPIYFMGREGVQINISYETYAQKYQFSDNERFLLSKDIHSKILEDLKIPNQMHTANRRAIERWIDYIIARHSLLAQYEAKRKAERAEEMKACIALGAIKEEDSPNYILKTKYFRLVYSFKHFSITTKELIFDNWEARGKEEQIMKMAQQAGL